MIKIALLCHGDGRARVDTSYACALFLQRHRRDLSLICHLLAPDNRMMRGCHARQGDILLRSLEQFTIGLVGRMSAPIHVQAAGSFEPALARHLTDRVRQNGWKLDFDVQAFSLELELQRRLGS